MKTDNKTHNKILLIYFNDYASLLILGRLATYVFISSFSLSISCIFSSTRFLYSSIFRWSIVEILLISSTSRSSKEARSFRSNLPINWTPYISGKKICRAWFLSRLNKLGGGKIPIFRPRKDLTCPGNPALLNQRLSAAQSYIKKAGLNYSSHRAPQRDGIVMHQAFLACCISSITKPSPPSTENYQVGLFQQISDVSPSIYWWTGFSFWLVSSKRTEQLHGIQGEIKHYLSEAPINFFRFWEIDRPFVRSKRCESKCL